MRRALAATALALALAGGATQHQPPTAAAAAQDTMNHAAVVIDTGDGAVRKLCLAFPEAEISGIEALQRVDTRPHRFETFSGKGSGVCMLCGVGCESGDCFCDRSNYWAYHRAGPGETQYRTSSVGASSTTVRDGDVEAWKWGHGAAPAKTTVSEVCNVPEPPSRTTSATTTTPNPPTTAPPTPTTESQSPGQTTPTPAPTMAPTTTPGARPPGATGTPTTEPPIPGAPEASPSEVADGSNPEGPEEEAAAPAAAEVKRSLGAEAGAAAETDATEGTTSKGELASLAAFTALIGALLVWRSRLRRANMRRVRPVR